MPIHRHTRHPLSIPFHSQLQPYSPSTMDSSVSFCLDHRVMVDNLSKLVKSFLLKKLLKPLWRLEQPIMSTETFKIAQDKHQLFTNGTHTYTYSDYQPSTQHTQIQQFNSIPFTIQCYLQPTQHRIYKGSCCPPDGTRSSDCISPSDQWDFFSISYPYCPTNLYLDVGHPLLGETQRKSSYLWPDTWPQPCEAQAKDSECFHVTFYQ